MRSPAEPGPATMSDAGATERPLARPVAFARAAVVALAVIVVDRLTKHAVVSGIAVGRRAQVPAGRATSSTCATAGVAFGFLSGGGALVLALTLAALAALLVYFLLRPTRPWLWLPTGLLVGGALGNLIDRLVERLGDRLHQAAVLAGVQRLRHGDHVRGAGPAVRARGTAPLARLRSDQLVRCS